MIIKIQIYDDENTLLGKGYFTQTNDGKEVIVTEFQYNNRPYKLQIDTGEEEELKEVLSKIFEKEIKIEKML